MMVVTAFAALAFSVSVDDPNNLIKNGGFDKDTVGTWRIYCHHAAQGTGGVVDGQLVFKVTAAGAYYDAQVFTTPNNWATLENGNTYVLFFDAKSDVARTLVFAVEDGENYNPLEYNANGGGKNPINLTTTMQTFESTFKMEKPTASNARICFNSGASTSTLTFDNVILIDKSKITSIVPRLMNTAASAQMINADALGLSFRITDPTHFGFQIFSPAGKLVANSDAFNRGAAANYRIDYKSLGISTGTYVVKALDGQQQGSKVFSVMN
jgi:hypothetical protein